MGRNAREFEQVAMPHASSLLRFAKRLTRGESLSEDLVQETLLRAWRGFGQFAAGTNARAWLFRILINTFHAHNRKERSCLPSLSLTADIRSESDSPSGSFEIVEALDRLGEDQRTALLLAAVEGFTCREIADILSVPIGTVMSRLSRAREAMRELLAPRGRKQGERVAR